MMAKSSKKRRERETEAVDHQELASINEAYTTGSFKYLRLLVHILGVAQFAYAAYFQWFKLPWRGGRAGEDLAARWAGPLKYLTYLNVLLQTVYHFIALLNDLFGSNSVSESCCLLKRFRDYMFSAWAFPLSHNVAISFWVIYAYDRELIFPAALDSVFPNWLNHIVHTNVVFLCILDLFTCFRRYPSRFVGAGSTFLMTFAYIVWLHVVHHNTGYWVYPIFNIVGAPLRYVLLSLMLCFTLACYRFGDYLNGVIWAKELQLLRRGKTKAA